MAMSVNSNKLKSLKELQELLADSKELTAVEYLSLLKQIQKNYTIKLAIASITDVMTQALSHLSIIEKVHYLIDSAEPKAEAESGTKKTSNAIGWEPTPEDEDLEKMFASDKTVDA